MGVRKKVRQKPKTDPWLKALGEKINSAIISKGYKSPYEFWVEKVGDEISRAGLNFIIAGKRDPKSGTLRVIGKALDLEASDLIPPFKEL